MQGTRWFSFHPNRAARFLLGCVVGLVVQHALFGAAAAFAFLAADFLNAGALGIDVALLESFDLVEQQTAGEKTVERLLAGVLAFDLETRRTMDQHHARRYLVHVLATVTARADKRLLNIRLAHAERRHALGKLAFLFRADGKRTHNNSVPGVRRKGNGGIESGKTLAAPVEMSSILPCKSYRTAYGWKKGRVGYSVW